MSGLFGALMHDLIKSKDAKDVKEALALLPTEPKVGARAVKGETARLYTRQPKSGVEGVTWEQDRFRWAIRAKVDGKMRRLGIYKELEGAVKAMDDKEGLIRKWRERHAVADS